MNCRLPAGNARDRIGNAPLEGGFTLIELAIVMFIMGLLLAGLIGPIETQLEARDREQTLDTMNTILEALYGFAVSNARLPCPDSNGDGLEDFAAGPPPFACVASQGWLPWSSLGTGQADAWGNRFRFVVAQPNYTTPDNGNCDATDFDLCQNGNITISSRGDNPATAAPVIEGKFLFSAANTLPAAVISHGRNGLGATSVQGVALPAPPMNSDEEENADADAQFIARTYSRTAAGCADDVDESTSLCAFDDMVTWISTPILNYRMVTAGRLP